MSKTLTYPAAGVNRLILEEMSANSVLNGSDLAEIEVLCEAQGGEPAFVSDGAALRLVGGVAVRATVPPGIAVTVSLVRGELRVIGVRGDVTLAQVQGDLRLTDISGDLQLGDVHADLRADHVADLHLGGTCDGNLRVDGCGNLTAERVAGDVRLHDSCDIRLGRVHGDVWVEKARGALEIGRANGDARLSEINGPTALGDVSGDLRAAALLGGLSAMQVHGDAVLNGPFTAEAGYQIAANGDISVQLPAEADARLTVQTSGRIRSDFRLTPAANGSPTYTAVLGRGRTAITLTCGGDVRLAQTGARSPADQAGDLTDLHNLGERIRQQVMTSLAAAGIAPPFDAAAKSRRPAAPERPRPPAQPPQASLEEQVAILKMVEQGQISPEEADTLLRALGV